MNKRTCCDKLWIKSAPKLSSFHFILHSIQFSMMRQLLRSLWAPNPKKNLVEIFVVYWLSVYVQKINVIQSFLSGYMCDQRILQSHWLKWGHFWPYFVIFAQREFFLKNPAKYNNKCQRYRVDWPSIQKLFHHYVKIVHSIC